MSNHNIDSAAITARMEAISPRRDCQDYSHLIPALRELIAHQRRAARLRLLERAATVVAAGGSLIILIILAMHA